MSDWARGEIAGMPAIDMHAHFGSHDHGAGTLVARMRSGDIEVVRRRAAAANVAITVVSSLQTFHPYGGDIIRGNEMAAQAAAEHKVKKMIYTMGGCSYPATAASPIDENQMWQGYPQQESAGYSVAKKMGLVASTSYRAQWGLNSVVLIPGNMYGEYDNFRTQESHVIPALIRRFYEARTAHQPQLPLVPRP